MVIVTNGLLAEGELTDVLSAAIDKYRPNAVYLREKHLCDRDFTAVARKAAELAKAENIPLFISHRADIAKALDIENIHVSFKNLIDINIADFKCVSVAVHSAAEAAEAQSLGADILVYGHIFPTDCKLNCKPKGLIELQKVVKATRLPVIAIGGITAYNASSALAAGAADYAIMSAAMRLNF